MGIVIRLSWLSVQNDSKSFRFRRLVIDAWLHELANERTAPPCSDSGRKVTQLGSESNVGLELFHVHPSVIHAVRGSHNPSLRGHSDFPRCT
jgi:hypothetical protein